MPLNLLDLPRELVDRIIDLVLTHQDSPPSSNCPSELKERVVWPQKESDLKTPPCGYNNVKYYKNHESLEQNWKSASLKLLLVSRGVAEITRQRLEYFSKSSHYALDVLLVNETELWPTWTFLTPPCQHVNSVTATIRIDGTSPTLDGRKYRLARHYIKFPPYTAPARIAWCFYYLLENFVQSGPLAEHSALAEHRHLSRGHDRSHQFTINELVLDFRTPTGLMAPSSMEFGNWLERHNNDTWEVETLMIRPEWLADMVSDCIWEVFHHDMHYESYENAFYDAIGRVRVCVDGIKAKEFAVDQYHKEYIDRTRLKLDNFPLHMFNYNMRFVSEGRKKAGLPVVD